MRLLVDILGTYFGAGRSPKAPGTVGTAFGLLTIAFIPGSTYGIAVGALIAIFLVLAPLIADRFVDALGVKDPQNFVLDEALGVWIAAFWPTHPGGRSLVLAFVFFRFFDILKPWPIRKIERLPKGWGVVYDDVLAGVFAALCVRAAAHFWP